MPVGQYHINCVISKGSFENGMVWLTQEQIAELFQRNQSVISRHIKNVFAEGELEQESNMQKVHIANLDKPASLWASLLKKQSLDLGNTK